MNSDARVLAGARELLEVRGWCQGAFFAPEGVCAVAAVGKAAQRLGVTSYMDALVALGEVTGGCAGGIIRWNDDPATTYEDVVLALKRAEELVSS